MNISVIKNIIHPSPHNLAFGIDIFFNKNFSKKPVIIFVHGYKSFKDWGTFNLIGKYFARNNFVFVKFNFSHNGTSIDKPDKITESENFGKNNLEIEVSEIQEVVNFIENFNQIDEREIDRKNIFLIGHSRGAAVGLIAANESSKIKKVVCWSMFNDFENTWRSFYNFDQWQEDGVNYRPNKLTGKPLPLYFSLYENYVANKHRFELKNIIQAFKKPIMLVHGIEDEYIPYEEAIEMKRWNYRIMLNLIPYANHNFGGNHPYLLKTLPEDTLFACKESILFFNQ